MEVADAISNQWVIAIYEWIKKLAGYYTRQAYPYLSYDDLYHIGIVMFLSIESNLDSSNNPKSYVRQKIVGAMKDEINHMRYWAKSSQARGKVQLFKIEPNMIVLKPDIDKAILARECLSIVESKARDILIMSFYDEMSPRQISDKLKISETEVEEIKYDTLNTLKYLMTKEEKMNNNDPVIKYVLEKPNISASEIAKALDMSLSTVCSRLKKNDVPYNINRGKKFYWLLKLSPTTKEKKTDQNYKAYTKSESVSLQENSAILLHARWKITKKPWHDEDSNVRTLFIKLTEFQIPMEAFNIIFQIDELINNPIV